MNAASAFVCLAGALFVCLAVEAYPSEDVKNSCSSDRECLFSMKCSNKKCVCKEGYYAHKDSCLGGIGSICNYDDDCIVDSFCKNRRTCECLEGLAESEDGSKCLGDAMASTRIAESSCDENFDCERFGEAFCETKVNQCQCRVDAHLRGARCWPSKDLGYQCTTSEECYSIKNPDSMECHPKSQRCVCKNGTQLSEDGNTCKGAPGRASVNLTSLLALIVSCVVAKIISA